MLGSLDPWLRRTLEQQAAVRSRGRYQLRIEQLQTSLWHRAIRLRGIHVRSAKATSRPGADAEWPLLRADVTELRVSGVGVWALLRGQVVPIDTVLVVGTRLRLLQLPRSLLNSPPLYRQLPRRAPGIRIGHLGIQRLRAAYGASKRPTASVRESTLTATDVLLSEAGAADTTRVAYARTLTAGFTGVLVRAHQHQLAIERGACSTVRHRFTLAALQVYPLSQPAAGQPAVDLSLPQLLLTGMQLGGLRQHRVSADSLVLRAPRLLTTQPTAPPPALHQLLAPYLRRVQLSHLLLRDGYVHLTGSRAAPTVRHLTVSATDIRIDATGARAPTRLLYARDWEVRTGKVSGVADAPYYRVACASLHAATAPGLLEVQRIVITPTVTPAELARRKGHQSPHITVRLPQLRVTGIDYAALQKSHALVARQVVVRQPQVHVAGDARFAVNPHPSIVTPETLGHLPFQFNIRQLRVIGGNLSTAYVAPKGGRGTIGFNRLQATLTNLTNDPRRMTRAHPLVVRATGRLQNRCAVRITLWAPLLDPRGTHWGEATFGPAPFAMLNSMTEPTRMTRFERGQIRRITLRLRVDRTHAQGTMRAEYTQLKLALLSRHGGADQKNLVTKAGSKLLNGVVVRDNNPRRAGAPPVIGRMSSQRDRRLTVVVFWRQNLISGLLNSAGVPHKLAVLIGQQQ
ncbi:MAG: hypothetical protein H7330_02620 [Hymenobacteraceae bacterium]|nr:hypothetical protein [Hymenobacteraceae bacterium]